MNRSAVVLGPPGTHVYALGSCGHDFRFPEGYDVPGHVECIVCEAVVRVAGLQKRSRTPEEGGRGVVDSGIHPDAASGA